MASCFDYRRDVPGCTDRREWTMLISERVRRVLAPFRVRSRSFFSSRRRHTRFKCDWSSDVCSSDLGTIREALKSLEVQGLITISTGPSGGGTVVEVPLDRTLQFMQNYLFFQEVTIDDRSEERRVGKECRSRWSPYH